MYINDIIEIFKEWSPEWAAWEADNIGLQIGDKKNTVTRILITLEITEDVVIEAIEKKVQLIISHHPLIFKPIRNISTSETTGKIISLLIKKNISVYIAHTNLDVTKNGVSYELAKTLGLKNIRFLAPLKNTLSKIVVFVPANYANKVMEAMSNAGAGIIGEYSHCSFQTEGKGTYKGSYLSNPFYGEKNKLETAEEIRLEMITERCNALKVINEMKKVHPYEEVAYDIYNIENIHSNYGMGAIGELVTPQKLNSFLLKVKRSLKCKFLRYNNGNRKFVQKIAVCGGAGSNLIDEAIKNNSDMFITSDIKYHTFQSAQDNIILVDAGHWETEHIILKSIAERIKKKARSYNKELVVFITKKKTNPVSVI